MQVKPLNRKKSVNYGRQYYSDNNKYTPSICKDLRSKKGVGQVKRIKPTETSVSNKIKSIVPQVAKKKASSPKRAWFF